MKYEESHSKLSLKYDHHQQNLMDTLQDETQTIVICHGPAGTGKTTIASDYAVRSAKNGAYEKIVLVRPLISVSNEDLGYLKGTLQQKMEPWMKPFLDTIEYLTGECPFEGDDDNREPSEKRSYFIRDVSIELCPLAYMRGRTFINTLIIADEMQNSTPEQMLMLLTRIGQGSKMVITGDLDQSDKPPPNGLEDLLGRIAKQSRSNSQVAAEDVVDISGITVVELPLSSVVRHPILQVVMNLYRQGKKGQSHYLPEATH
jgi:phosphate starvation-inducible PhoH-like protein